VEIVVGKAVYIILYITLFFMVRHLLLFCSLL